MYPLLLEIYILYRANHNQTRLAPLPPFPFSFHSFSFFSFLSLSLEIYLLSCDDDVLHAFRGEARAQSRSGVDTRGKRGGGTPLVENQESIITAICLCHDCILRGRVVVEGGRTPARKLRHEAERGCTRVGRANSHVGYMCHSANKSSARTGSSTRNNYLFWERVFSSFFWRRGGGRKLVQFVKVSDKAGNQKFSNMKFNLFIFVTRFLFISACSVQLFIQVLCIMYNIISSLINARVGSALIV